MKTKLSHKDLVKLGRYEASQGYSLNKIEADFLKKGINRADTIKALEEVDYYNKIEQSKIQKSDKKQGNKPSVTNRLNAGSPQAANKKKSSFWLWFILLALIGVTLYLYFSSTINFDWIHSINFK